MSHPKVLSIFNSLDQQSLNICLEIDAFMGSIINWADELAKIVEKEFSAGKQSTLFLLPKTPSEKKTRNKKGRNALVSKCSEVNLEFSKYETSNKDDTTTLKTRGAKRAAASKFSQFNFTLEKPEEATVQTAIIKPNTKDATDATFVLPKATGRTKSVLKNKQPDPNTSELQRNENQVPNSLNGSAVRESSSRKISGTSANISPKAPMQSKTFTTLNSSSPQQQNLEQSTSPKETSKIITEIPAERSSRSRVTRSSSASSASHLGRATLYRSHSERSSKAGVPRSPSNSPRTRSSSLRNLRSGSKTVPLQSSKASIANTYILDVNNVSTSQDDKVRVSETRNFFGNETVTIKKESSVKGLSTYIVNETQDSVTDEEGTPIVTGENHLRLTNMPTPAADVEKTPIVQHQDQVDINMDENLMSSTRIIDVAESKKNISFSGDENLTEEISEDVQVPKKKRKLKKDEEVKENVEEMADNVRITRTKSKALKKMMEENETKQADLSAFAKKLLNRAKMTSLKKNQLAALLDCNTSTPKNGVGHLGNNLPFGNLTTSKSKYHLLLSGSKKLKTPLATLPNSAMKILKAVKESGDKIKIKAGRDSSVENLVRSVAKPSKDDILEKEIKLQSRKEKEKEAALKRQNVIKTKQEELKRKNELKHQMAMKQREKLEQEKYHNMIQSEKEKEERHKLILQERQIKQKEEAFKKKMMTQQKIAETVERRRIEEEARLAKLKEMEVEEQRLALEKQKEQERQEKRAQERLAQKKAREEYEMQLKQELEAERLRAEKLQTAKKGLPSASKIRSASKRQKFGVMGEKRDWDYKPRHENDYGLEDENSEIDSGDEKPYDKNKPAVPWGKRVMHGQSPVVRILTLEMLCEFMPCHQKSPDIYKMFRMTPSKRIKRSSSAIWNTPSS